MAEQLMEGANTSCTQPSINATRLALGSLPISDRGLVTFALSMPGGTSARAAAGRSRPARAMTTERPGQPAQHQREPEAAGMGQHLAQDHAQKALARRAVTLHLDARPGGIDEMHVVDPLGQAVMQEKQERQRSM